MEIYEDLRPRNCVEGVRPIACGRPVKAASRVALAKRIAFLFGPIQQGILARDAVDFVLLRRAWPLSFWPRENFREHLIQPSDSAGQTETRGQVSRQVLGTGFRCTSNPSPTSEVGTAPTIGEGSSACKRWTITSGRC